MKTIIIFNQGCAIITISKIEKFANLEILKYSILFAHSYFESIKRESKLFDRFTGVLKFLLTFKGL